MEHIISIPITPAGSGRAGPPGGLRSGTAERAGLPKKTPQALGPVGQALPASAGLLWGHPKTPEAAARSGSDELDAGRLWHTDCTDAPGDALLCHRRGLHLPGGWGRVSVAVLADGAGCAQPAPGVLSLLSQSGQPRGAAGPDALRTFLRRPGDRRAGHRKRGGRSPYDPAARNLLRKQQFGHGSSPVQAVFSPSDLSLHFDQGPEPIQKLSYDCFECVIETQDLLLPVRDGRVIVLQKKDLPAGALPELREYLREQVLYMAVVPTAAHR